MERPQSNNSDENILRSLCVSTIFTLSFVHVNFVTLFDELWPEIRLRVVFPPARVKGGSVLAINTKHYVKDRTQDLGWRPEYGSVRLLVILLSTALLVDMHSTLVQIYILL